MGAKPRIHQDGNQKKIANIELFRQSDYIYLLQINPVVRRIFNRRFKRLFININTHKNLLTALKMLLKQNKARKE